MKKRILILAVCVLLIASVAIGLVACNSKAKNETFNTTFAEKYNDFAPDFSYVGDLTGKTLNVGAVYIGDTNETYTYAHDLGIKTAIETLKSKGATVNVSYKPSVGEDATKVSTAISELVSWSKQTERASYPTIIITNSYGHQYQYGAGDNHFAKANSGIQFVAMTGDLAAGSGYANYHNAFNATYQSRYVAGVAAGYKLKQLVEDGKLSDKNYDGENIRLGYVGAFPFAEVKSGYTAFYLGVKSVVDNVTMHVKFTESWSTEEGEREAAKALIAEGCVIISQHADTVGAPTACQEAWEEGTVVYNVGYNQDLLAAAPNAVLTSAMNNWAVYYTHAFYKTLMGEAIDTNNNWSAGYEAAAVDITKLNGNAFKTDISAELKAVIEKLQNGTLHVFDCSKFTVNGRPLTTYQANVHPDDNNQYIPDTEAIHDGYFHESEYRSAPYFDIDIDGINPDAVD